MQIISNRSKQHLWSHSCRPSGRPACVRAKSWAVFNLARTVRWTVGRPGRAASFGPSTISSWDQRATVEVSPCSEGGQGKDEAANGFPGNRTRDHWISRPERILWATGASALAHPPVLGGCAWAGCSGTRPIRPSLRARRPWANGVQLGPDEGRLESIITRRDYGARWDGWLGRHKMNLAYRLVSRIYLKTVWIGGGRLLAVKQRVLSVQSMLWTIVQFLDGVQSFCIIAYIEAKWVSECDQAFLLIANNIPTHHSSVQKLRTHVFKLG